jgi:hypothetical protein
MHRAYPRYISSMQALSALLLVTQLAQVVAPKSEVGQVPEPLRAERQLDAFYQKHLDLAGFALLGSARVSDAAMREARWILAHVLEGREDVLRELTRRRVHLVVMAHDEYTTDVPEQRKMTPAVYWDRRARGLGGCAKRSSADRPFLRDFSAACGEVGALETYPPEDQVVAAPARRDASAELRFEVPVGRPARDPYP